MHHLPPGSSRERTSRSQCRQDRLKSVNYLERRKQQQRDCSRLPTFDFFRIERVRRDQHRRESGNVVAVEMPSERGKVVDSLYRISSPGIFDGKAFAFLFLSFIRQLYASSRLPHRLPLSPPPSVPVQLAHMVFTIFFLIAAARLAQSSAISTSVFPNSACAGASSQSGFVGIGKVVLSSGEIEIHCGCPSVRVVSLSLSRQRVWVRSATLASSSGVIGRAMFWFLKNNVDRRVELTPFFISLTLALCSRTTCPSSKLVLPLPMGSLSATRYSTWSEELSLLLAISFPALDRELSSVAALWGYTLTSLCSAIALLPL